MKIIFDATVLSNADSKTTYRSGIFYTAYNLLFELKKLGHYIELYCNYTEYYKLKRLTEFKDFKIIPEYSLFNKITGLIFYFLGFFPAITQPYIRILNRLFSYYLNVKSKRKQKYFENFDIYFSPFTPPSEEIKQSNIKQYRIIHDLIPIIEGASLNNTFNIFRWYDKVYSSINSDNYYIADSENTRQDILKQFPFIEEKNIKTALLGANANFYPSNDKSPIENKYIFSLCSLGKRKNLAFGIRCFFKFIEKNNISDIKLVLGGSIWNKYKKTLYNTLKQYDTTKVILTGYIDETELAKYYSNALCFIYPSLYEGFGLPVLEAMQCGCPVITSNTSSLPEVIGDAGIQINPTSDKEMIAAYEKMYFDEEFRNNCIEKGLERARQFSWEKCAKEILDFIQSTL